MFLHDLKSPKGSRKRRKIVGRGQGSGHGKTSCKGMNGQNCRSGRAVILGSEGGQMSLIRRLPKVGFRSKNPIFYQVVKLDSLKKIKEGTVVDAAYLKSHGLIRSLNRPFKILGEGELKKALIVHANAFSKSAEEKIVQAGGKIETIVKSETTEQEPAKEAKS